MYPIVSEIENKIPTSDFSQQLLRPGVSVPGVNMVKYTEDLMEQLHKCVVFQRMKTEEGCTKMIEEFFQVQEGMSSSFFYKLCNYQLLKLQNN